MPDRSEPAPAPLPAALALAAPALEEPARAFLARNARRVHLPAGAALFRPGDACRQFLLVGTGGVRVDLLGEAGQALLLYRVGPGQSCVLTTACLMAHEPYSAEGRAEHDTEGWVLARPAFERLMAESAAFRGFVLAGFGARLADVMARVEAVAFQSVDQRLANALLARADAQGRVAATHAALAADAGAAREVVSRRLKAMERRGLVVLARGQVRITRAEALRALGAGADGEAPDGN